MNILKLFSLGINSALDFFQLLLRSVTLHPNNVSMLRVFEKQVQCGPGSAPLKSGPISCMLFLPEVSYSVFQIISFYVVSMYVFFFWVVLAM